MEIVIEREAKGVREIAIREKDLILQWKGDTDKLVKVRSKGTRAMEVWYNERITEENIQEITALNITKSGKSLALEIYPEKSIYVKLNLSRISVPISFVKTPINRGIFGEIFGETSEL